MTHREDGSLPLRWKLILAVLPFAAALIALGIGRIFIAPGDVMAALAAKFDPGAEVEDLVKMTIWNLRVPRILLAALVGAGLSVAGCAFQSLFANPLATPDTLGVASGASFGAALAILMGFKMIGIQAVSLLMGLAAVTLTYLAGTGKNRGLSSVVLSGIMIGSLFSALVSLVKFTQKLLEAFDVNATCNQIHHRHTDNLLHRLIAEHFKIGVISENMHPLIDVSYC